MTALIPVAEKLGKLIPRLASDSEGEVVATVAALRRTLEVAGLDLHDLAAALTKGATPVVVYRDRWRDPPSPKRPELDWAATARWCAGQAHRLNAKERGFVLDMAAALRFRRPTEKQAAWLATIHSRLRRATR